MKNHHQGEVFNHTGIEGYFIHAPGVVLTTNQFAEIDDKNGYIVDNLPLSPNMNITLFPAMLVAEYLGIKTSTLIDAVKNKNLIFDIEHNEDFTEVYYLFEVGDHSCKLTSSIDI